MRIILNPLVLGLSMLIAGGFAVAEPTMEEALQAINVTNVMIAEEEADNATVESEIESMRTEIAELLEVVTDPQDIASLGQASAHLTDAEDDMDNSWVHLDVDADFDIQGAGASWVAGRFQECVDRCNLAVGHTNDAEYDRWLAEDDIALARDLIHSVYN